MSTDSGVGFLLEPIEWEESEFVHNALGQALQAAPLQALLPNRKRLRIFFFASQNNLMMKSPRTEEERAGQGTTLTRNT